jgi:phosphoglycolate phosphatase-like HAD superfamily hydrolase
MKIKAIIFDFDLTLVDSFKALHAAWRDFEKHHQIYFSKIPEKEIWGMPKELLFKKVAKLNGNKLSWQQIRELATKYTAKHYSDLKFKDQKMLQGFNKKKIKLGILSYGFYATVLKTSKNIKNRKIKFDFIFTSDRGPGRTKEQFLNYILKKCKIKKDELIYIGDHPQDIEAGKKAGVVSGAVATGLFFFKQLKKYHPDILISKLSELKKYVDFK